MYYLPHHTFNALFSKQPSNGKTSIFYITHLPGVAEKRYLLPDLLYKPLTYSANLSRILGHTLSWSRACNLFSNLLPLRNSGRL